MDIDGSLKIVIQVPANWLPQGQPQHFEVTSWVLGGVHLSLPSGCNAASNSYLMQHKTVDICS